MWHDDFRVDSRDKWFVCASNPSGDGGGVVISTNSWNYALTMKIEAIKRGYTKVNIMTWDEMHQHQPELES